MRSCDATAVERLDKLVESMLGKLEKLKAIARALAEYEVSVAQQVRALDTDSTLKPTASAHAPELQVQTTP